MFLAAVLVTSFYHTLTSGMLGGEQVGEIVHMYPGWQKAFYTAESNWMISFPTEADAVHKALLIGACQLSKFFFFPGHVCGTGLGYFC